MVTFSPTRRQVDVTLAFGKRVKTKLTRPLLKLVLLLLQLLHLLLHLLHLLNLRPLQILLTLLLLLKLLLLLQLLKPSCQKVNLSLKHHPIFHGTVPQLDKEVP